MANPSKTFAGVAASRPVLNEAEGAACLHLPAFL